MPGISGFCGSVLNPEIITGPLLLLPASLPEPPQPLSSMANDNAAAARASAFFFIYFSCSVGCKDAEESLLHAKEAAKIRPPC
ncbi:hypothetical protein [Bifidobacterium subtile]|uniref:hypothetical protein n=1 Tax=Bifidobacterium subtile TaxID=77635 RepID=UPI001F190AA0|nr:hypothetical protein [Bifidobacterium subtile]